MSNNDLIIAPGRNEAKFMRRTLDSLVTQGVRPRLLLIVHGDLPHLIEHRDPSPEILSNVVDR